MRRAKGVIFALGALGETGEAAALPKRANPIAATGQNLVGIALMPDIPDQTVIGRIEGVVECDGQLDNAKPGAEMTSGHRNGIDCFAAQFICKLTQKTLVQPAQIMRRLYLVEQRRFDQPGHGDNSLVNALAFILKRLARLTEISTESPRDRTRRGHL